MKKDEILKEAYEFAESQMKMNRIVNKKDGSCIYCGANPEIFANYIATAMQQARQEALEEVEKKIAGILYHDDDPRTYLVEDIEQAINKLKSNPPKGG